MPCRRADNGSTRQAHLGREERHHPHRAILAATMRLLQLRSNSAVPRQVVQHEAGTTGGRTSSNLHRHRGECSRADESPVGACSAKAGHGEYVSTESTDAYGEGGRGPASEDEDLAGDQQRESGLGSQGSYKDALATEHASGRGLLDTVRT